MKPIRVEQRKNEGVDMLAFRMLGRCLPRMAAHEREAFWSYMEQRAQAELMPRLSYGDNDAR